MDQQFTTAEMEEHLSRLTPRQREISELACRGLTYREIALRVFLSHSTIKTHMVGILSKTGTLNLVQLAYWMGRTWNGDKNAETK